MRRTISLLGILICVLIASPALGDESKTRMVTDQASGLSLRLPVAWERHQSGRPVMYASPQTPQYNFLMSRMDRPLEHLERAESLASMAGVLISGNPTAQSPVERVATSDRVLWYYTSSLTEERGRAKDDRHWLLLIRGKTAVHLATFTLSVLAERADSAETDRLAKLLDAKIAEAAAVE